VSATTRRNLPDIIDAMLVEIPETQAELRAQLLATIWRPHEDKALSWRRAGKELYRAFGEQPTEDWQRRVVDIFFMGTTDTEAQAPAADTAEAIATEIERIIPFAFNSSDSRRDAILALARRVRALDQRAIRTIDDLRAFIARYAWHHADAVEIAGHTELAAQIRAEATKLLGGDATGAFKSPVERVRRIVAGDTVRGSS
jgi:hypothetical protein